MEKNTNIPSPSTLVKRGISIKLLQSVLPLSGIRFTPRKKEGGSGQKASQKETGVVQQTEEVEDEKKKDMKMVEVVEEDKEDDGQEEWEEEDEDEDEDEDDEPGSRPVEIFVHSYRSMRLEERREMMDVLEKNMKVMYQNTSEGWSRPKKQNELSSKSANMRFLLARPVPSYSSATSSSSSFTPTSTTNTTTTPTTATESPPPEPPTKTSSLAGFVAFTMARTLNSPLPRSPSQSQSQTPPPITNTAKELTPPLAGFIAFTPVLEPEIYTKPSEGIPCLYCYEIQITPKYQGTGLGGHLMQLMHAVAKEIGVRDVRLTVFKANSKARGFYEKLGYEIYCNDAEDDYVIMRKFV